MIDPNHYGISFSLKQCRNFRIDGRTCLDWLLEVGWRRFRLMSYWNEHEKVRGVYDFSELDWQVALVEKAAGVVSLCLGVKQPRWPEYHWPTWAKDLPRADKEAALLAYIQAVVERYHDREVIVSYQLENEALLSNFGRDIDIDRRRLRREYALVRRLEPTKPILMSTSNGWGVPARRPRPHGGVGFSVYTVMHQKGAYRRTIQKPWLHRVRASLIRYGLGRDVFIHELQCEPWGPKAIWEMSVEEQNESMPPERIAQNIAWAKRIGAYPIDLWGAEWWYWRWKKADATVWKTVLKAVQDDL